MSREAGASADPIRRTLVLSRALGLQVDAGELEALYRGLGAELTEWSINPAGHGRGRLRLSAWTRDHAAVERWLEERGAGALLALRRGLPRRDFEGLGLAWGAGPPRLRWWQLAPTDGSALAAAAGEIPELAGAREALEADCGGARRIRALGAEVDGGGLRRVSLYASVPGPRALIAALERAAFPATDRSRRFFRGLVGVGRRPWPKLWVAYSAGRGGGWKFYLFLRGDPGRPPDGEVLELLGADAGARAAAAALGPPPVVQIAGLGLADGAVSCTLYLSAAAGS